MTPRKFFFVLIGLIVIGITGGAGGYYFALQQINASSKVIRSQLAEQRQNEEILTNLSAARAQYKKDIVPILPNLTAVLPQNKNQSEILVQLQTLAKASGLTISSASFPSAGTLPSQTSQTTKVGPTLALPITFQVTGRYEQLQNFLTSIETLNRLTSVTNLVISHPDSTNFNLLNYALTVNTFVKP